jgi:hypothetical protein
MRWDRDARSLVGGDKNGVIRELFVYCNRVQYAMKAYGGVDAQIHIFLTSALVGGEWSASRPGRFTPRKEPQVPIE